MAFEIARGKPEQFGGCQASTSLPKPTDWADSTAAGPAGAGDLELLSPCRLAMAPGEIQRNVAQDEQLENGEKAERRSSGRVFF